MYKPPGGLIFGGAIERRVFCVTILRGLYMEGLSFGILRYPINKIEEFLPKNIVSDGTTVCEAVSSV